MSGPNLTKETIPIKGMHCKSCAHIIESGLRDLDGVEEVHVDLVSEHAIVLYDSSKIGFDTIKSAILSLGYSVDGKLEATDRAAKGDETGKREKGSNANNKDTFFHGILYGLTPHFGCIAFIIGSVLGVTVLMQFFRPLLMNPYFFHILIAISIGFATLSIALYLKSNGLLSVAGARKKWKYIATMYGSTIGINLLLFMFIFPLLANIAISQPANTAAFVGSTGALASIDLQVSIPCPGHAPLISSEINTLPGISSITFTQPNYFNVVYDPSQVTKEQILALEVFQSFKATVVSEQIISRQRDNGSSSATFSGGICSLSPSGSSGSCGAVKTSGCGCGATSNTQTTTIQ